MKPVLMIYPPFEGKNLLKSREPFPIGLLYLASYIKEYGNIESEIVDFGFPFEQTKVDRPSALKTAQKKYVRYGTSDEEIRIYLKKNLNRFHDVVCVSSLMSSTYNGGYKVIEIIRELKKDAIILVGGPHATAFPDHVFKNTSADFICIGEGELALLAFLTKGSSDSIISRDYKELPETYKVEDLDILPFPSRSLIPDRKIDEMVITFSRGCPHKCSFCGSHLVQGRKWRHKSVDRVIEEIKFYNKEWGIKKFSVEDDNLCPGKVGMEWISEICRRIIKELPKMRFHVPHGIPVYATANEEVCKLLWDAGFRGMVFPLESTNPATLKDMNKEFTPKFYPQATKNWSIYEKPFPTEIIIGYPFVDTIESMLKTMLDITEMGGLVWASHFRLNKGTALYERCLEAGYIDSTYDPINTQAFFIETERFNIVELTELMAIGRGLNFGTERGFNFIKDPIEKANFTDYQFISQKPQVGSLVAKGKFSFNRSQKPFTGLLLHRIGITGRPLTTVSEKKDEISYTGAKKSRVYDVLQMILTEKGLVENKKRSIQDFMKKR